LIKTTDAADIVDLSRYPIADLESAEGVACVSQYRQDFNEAGLCILPNFIRADALRKLADESNAVTDQAYFCQSTHNVYLTDEDRELPADDVARRQETTYVGSVAYDRIGEDCTLRRLYLWEPLRQFIGSVLGKSEFYRLADPLGACSINVFVDGGEHGWHFDESEFSVTLMLQEPETGGAFEYVSGVRNSDDEKKLLTDILNGDRSRVAQLPFTPGTLLIFSGRQSVHRVTAVRGAVPRLVPVLCYSDTPNHVNSEKVRRLFWGRADADC
jgi:alkylated DNA repair dioxygenase AlkB